VAPDFGIIFKPGDEVYYEHPGLCWFKVTVRGTLGYAGLPRGIPGFRSSIVPAADVIKELEQWLREYPDKHQTAQVRPEGWIAALRSGWPEKAAFPSAATEIYVDIRTNPDQTNASLQQEFDGVMKAIASRHADIEVDWEMYATCQASRTDPSNWIVQSALRGWQQRHGRPYTGAPHTSGQTDAATIGQLGIPLVRIGYPFAVDLPSEYSEGLGGMGVARIADLIGPCESVVYSIIDTCTRTRGEVGLQ
jgi:acetylornithine deacetylase/succinyl-diaminopimelate desuccinylase-like protein